MNANVMKIQLGHHFFVILTFDFKVLVWMHKFSGPLGTCRKVFYSHAVHILPINDTSSKSLNEG